MTASTASTKRMTKIGTKIGTKFVLLLELEVIMLNGPPVVTCCVVDDDAAGGCGAACVVRPASAAKSPQSDEVTLVTLRPLFVSTGSLSSYITNKAITNWHGDCVGVGSTRSVTVVVGAARFELNVVPRILRLDSGQFSAVENSLRSRF